MSESTPTHESGDFLIEVDKASDKTLAELVRSEMLERAEKRNRMLALRRLGMTVSQIAEQMTSEGTPVDPSTVSRHLRKHLEAIASEDRESTTALRALEDERLDAILRGHMEKATGGDHKAARVVIQVSERRAKMHGLDAPQKVEVGGRVSLLHELGVDPEEIKREREAFETAYQRPGLPDPAETIDIPDSDIEDVSSIDA